MQSNTLFPLVVRGDISHICTDVIVYSTGCFLSPGYLTNSLRKLYSKKFQNFLETRLKIGKRPRNLPPKEIRTAKDVDVKKFGGLEQGFTSFIPAKDLRDIPGAHSKAPAIIVAIAGGEYKGHINPNSVRELVENVFSSAAENLPYKQNKNYTLVFPTIGIGMGGGKDDRLPVLKAQVKALNAGYARYPHLIPILLTYSETVHHLALTARRDILPLQQPQFFIQDANKAISLLQHDLTTGRLIVFAGAGISYASGLPDWRGLVKALSKEANLYSSLAQKENSEELLQMAEQARKALGKNFGKTLTKALGFKGENTPFPAVTHYQLATLPVPYIVTTNYDNLLEQALSCIKKAFFAIHRPQDVARMPTVNQTYVLKLHGDFTAPEDVVLTQSDYKSFFHKRPAVSAMLKGLLLNRTFLFLGYSLRDPNLHTILDEVSSLLKKARREAYAIVLDATPEEVDFWRNQGVHLFRLLGDSFQEKNKNLWQFLDILQWQSYARYRTWLAEDVTEILPKNPGLLKTVENLKEALCGLQQEIERKKNLSPELADFVFPWLLLGVKHGLDLPPYFWESFIKHYKQRQPQMESTLLMALEAQIAAFNASEGSLEEEYRRGLVEIQKKLREKNY